MQQQLGQGSTTVERGRTLSEMVPSSLPKFKLGTWAGGTKMVEVTAAEVYRQCTKPEVR